MAAAAATPAPAAPPVAALQPNVNAAPAADTSAGDETFSVRILLSVLVCVLALAAIIGPMIFKYIRPRRKQPIYAPRRPIWDMDVSSENVRQDDPRIPSLIRHRYVDPLPEPHVLDEAVDELESLLARASRRPAA